jgi:chromosome segregation ATPase
VLTAQVHGDEHKYVTDETGKKVDISKDHLHIIAVPAVACTKHEGYEWKMSAHDLTSKTRFKMFHPGLQRACDEAGIHATVYKRTSSDGKTIPLTVKQLKEITNKTGIVLNHSVTVDELAQILQSNVNFSKSFDKLKEQIKEKNNTISALQNDVSTRNAAITNLQTQINTKNAEINRAKSVNLSADTEKRNLQSQVQRKDVENQKLRQDIQKLADEKLTEKTQMLSAITSKGNELRTATEQYKQLQQSYVNLQSKVNEKDFTIEALKSNIATLNTAITSLQTQISVKNDEIIRIKNVNLSADAEKRNLQSQVQKKDVENQKLRQDIQKLADEKLTEKNQMLAAINAKNIELQRASEQVKQLENQLENAKIIMSELQRQNVTPVHQQEHTQTWGTNHTWGMSQGWGNVNNHDKNITIEEEQ